MAQTHVQKFSRIIVTVQREIAESFGQALIELGAGAVEERPTRHADTVEILLSLPEGESTEPWQAIMRSLYQAFAEQLELPTEGFSLRQEKHALDYHEGWLKQLTLVQLTDTVALSPVHDDTPPRPGSSLLRFVPKPSFGDGSHPTTRLIAAAVERYTVEHPHGRVLDVGTGNGVLCLVAALRGASALGIDIDPFAVESARENARLNQLDSCEFSTTPLSEVLETFELVMANLEPLTQLEVADGIAPRLASGGTLLLTGFLEEQAAMIEPLYQLLGYRVAERVPLEGYVLLRLLAPTRSCDEASA